MAKNDLVVELENGDKQVKCKKKGKDIYMYTPAGVGVYDSRGKRKMGKNGKVIVKTLERVRIDDEEYLVKELGETYVILKKV